MKFKSLSILFFSILLLFSCATIQQPSEQPPVPGPLPRSPDALQEAAAAGEAVKIRGFTSLTGEVSGSLDNIAESSLADNDLGLTWDLTSDTIYFHRFDADDVTAVEVSPYFIFPKSRVDDDGTWTLFQAFAFNRDSTPKSIYRDSDATDFDDNAYWQYNCTDVDSGEEDCDATLYLQIAGTATAVLTWDADIGPQFLMDSSPDTDDLWTGSKMLVTAGEALSQWDIVYIRNDSGTAKAYKYDANNATYKDEPPRGIVLASSISQDATGYIGIGTGIARNDGWSQTTNQDEGKRVYASTTAGAITLTKPSSSGDRIFLLGSVIEENVILFSFMGGVDSDIIGSPIFVLNAIDPTTDIIDIQKYFERGITVTNVVMNCTAGTSVSARLWEVDTDGDDSDAAGIDSAAWTVTCGTKFTDNSFTNAAIDDGDFLQLDVTAVSGSVTQWGITVFGYEN